MPDNVPNCPTPGCPFRRGMTAHPPLPLSPRECTVVHMLAAGHRNKAIADRLRISIKTVETYRAKAYAKLGVTDLVSLVHYAYEHGWFGAGRCE